MEQNRFQNTHVSYSAPERPLRNYDDGFAQQDLSFNDTPFLFPSGFEKLFLILYLIFLPYIAGILFLFFYIAKAKFELFDSLNDESSFIFSWLIGYEILATLILLYIVKMAISFSLEAKNEEKRIQSFRRPS